MKEIKFDIHSDIGTIAVTIEGETPAELASGLRNEIMQALEFSEQATIEQGGNVYKFKFEGGNIHAYIQANGMSNYYPPEYVNSVLSQICVNASRTQ